MAKPTDYSATTTRCQLRHLERTNDVASEAAAPLAKNVGEIAPNDTSGIENSEPKRCNTGFCNLRILIRLHA